MGGGLPKQFKVMMAYPQASGNENMYLDYFQVAQEAEKEEAMDPSHNLPVANANKPLEMSFCPLQKLKGSHLATTPSSQVGHLEEESANKEEPIDSEDPPRLH